MKLFKTHTTLLVILVLFLPVAASAHFGTILVKHPVLTSQYKRTQVSFSFVHPFEQHGMDLQRPQKVGIEYLGSQNPREITSKLKPFKLMGHQAWKTVFKPQRPGVYCIYMEPQPYWEKSEDVFIKHITKTYIGAFGVDQGWSQPIGLKTEIVPLTRPFGLYAKNVFQGQVYLNGEVVPHAEIEVEYYNRNHKAQAANDYMITQVIRADENGVFTYSPPKHGWWGFSALNKADYKLEKNGEKKNVELGAVIWVHFLPWNKK